MTEEIKTPDRPICEYCGNTPRTTLKNHWKHCKEKPKGKPGRPKKSSKVAGSGRTKGSLNKSTKTAKQQIQETFEKLGGVDAMVAWATRNQEAFYTKIYIKILPLDTNVRHNMDNVPALTVNLTHKPKDKDDKSDS